MILFGNLKESDTSSINGETLSKDCLRIRNVLGRCATGCGRSAGWNLEEMGSSNCLVRRTTFLNRYHDDGDLHLALCFDILGTQWVLSDQCRG